MNTISKLSEQFQLFTEGKRRFVIIQADNPDGDSLASSLALEEILCELGKEVELYCGVEIPSYLRYMSGWDRVSSELPRDFDGSIIVDTSAISLLETLVKNDDLKWLKLKPAIYIDHHQTEGTIDFAEGIIDSTAVSTGQIIFKIASHLQYSLTLEANEFIGYSVLSDTLGLSSEAVDSSVFRLMAEIVDNGVSVAKLDDARRSLSKKSKRIVEYKGKLLTRIEFFDDPRIALITIPWAEIEQYSHEYNPSMLVIDEMRMIEGVQVAIAFKTYPDGKITAKIRANYGYKIAAKLAEQFGGGGHPYAAGFKITEKTDLSSVKSKCLEVASRLLDELSSNDK